MKCTDDEFQEIADIVLKSVYKSGFVIIPKEPNDAVADKIMVQIVQFMMSSDDASGRELSRKIYKSITNPSQKFSIKEN